MGERERAGERRGVIVSLGMKMKMKGGIVFN